MRARTSRKVIAGRGGERWCERRLEARPDRLENFTDQSVFGRHVVQTTRSLMPRCLATLPNVSWLSPSANATSSAPASTSSLVCL